MKGVFFLLSIATLATANASARNHLPAPRCSAATLQGRYIFAGNGIIEAAEPGVQRVHYGSFIFDGVGRLAGKQSSSRGGRIGREELEGSYRLEPDCSGSMTFQFAGRPDSETHWDLYVTADGRMGHIIRMDEGSMAVRSFQR